MRFSKKIILSSLLVLLLFFPNQSNGDADNLDRTKVGVKVGEIYMAQVVKYDAFPFYDVGDDQEELIIPKPGDIFVTFEILEIDPATGIIKLNLTFTENFFGENPEPSEIDKFSLEDISEGLFIYTDWDYWKVNLTKAFEQDEFDDQSTVEIIDTSSEFGFKSTYQDENDWPFGEVTTNVHTSEFVYDKSTGAIKRVKEFQTYTFQNGTVITSTQEFVIAKTFADDSLDIPGFELHISFAVIGIIAFTRKKTT